MKTLKTTILFALFLSLVFTSCKKNGTGGDATITMTVKHHDLIIPEATIYIKYDAKDLPGTDLSAYDDNVKADANGYAKFEGLLKGDYYLYSVGYDSSISETVNGGLGVVISKRSEIKEVTVQVTEH